MSEALNLEQANARRMAAESEAVSLRDQLAARDASDQRRADDAALAKSIAYGGEVGALRRDVARLQQAQEEAQGREDSTFGENGVQANSGVIRGSGGGSGGAQVQDSIIRVIISFSGGAEYVALKGQRLGTAENTA